MKQPLSFHNLNHITKIFVGHVTSAGCWRALGFDLQHILGCPNSWVSKRTIIFKALMEYFKAAFALLALTLSHHMVLVRFESNIQINSHRPQKLITFTKRFMSSGESRGEVPCGVKNSGNFKRCSGRFLTFTCLCPGISFSLS